nr:hypothetical protein [Tanacetum cinerariifolium]
MHPFAGGSGDVMVVMRSGDDVMVMATRMAVVMVAAAGRWRWCRSMGDKGDVVWCRRCGDGGKGGVVGYVVVVVGGGVDDDDDDGVMMMMMDLVEWYLPQLPAAVAENPPEHG